MSKYITKQEALTKLQRYCAYQDRCHQEVRSKLLDLGMRGFDLEDVIAELIQENFLNEERFARSFVRGKFRMKQWGKRKIEIELKKKDIPAYCIKMGFTEIEEDDYWQTLIDVLIKKNTTTAAKNLYERKQKLGQYAMRRGFESHLVWKAVNELELEE